jgi:hypothetical protein
MSQFVWEVSEAEDNAAAEVSGGAICLEELKAVRGESAWDIQPRGESNAVAKQRGGEVRLRGGNTRLASSGPQGPDRGIINFALVVFILLVALLVINDMYHGTLTFSQFIERVVYLLAGAGINQLKKRQPPRTR